MPAKPMAMVLCAMIALMPLACRKAAEKTTEKIVKEGKEAVGGISEGIEKGRKSSAGQDGAIIISTDAELAQNAKVTVFALRQGEGDKEAVVEMAVENQKDVPLRLTDLHKTGGCALIDKDGFSSPLNERATDPEMTVLPKAKQKVVLHFKASVSTAATVLFYGKKYPIETPASGPTSKP